MRRHPVPRTEPDAEPGDSGFSLTELMVAMAIFAVVITVFISGMMSMTQSTVRAQNITDSGDSVRQAFQSMDKQIRYSSSINFPGVGASGSQYVEFITTAQPDGLDPLCTQWRYDPTAGTLGYRTWRDNPSAGVSGWRLVAFDVRNDMGGASPKPPFRLTAAGGDFLRQQLTVSVDAGPENGDPGADTTTVFVARNSSGDSPSNLDLNGDHVSDTPVCASHLDRP